MNRLMFDAQKSILDRRYPPGWWAFLPSIPDRDTLDSGRLLTRTIER